MNREAHIRLRRATRPHLTRSGRRMKLFAAAVPTSTLHTHLVKCSQWKMFPARYLMSGVSSLMSFLNPSFFTVLIGSMSFAMKYATGPVTLAKADMRVCCWGVALTGPVLVEGPLTLVWHRRFLLSVCSSGWYCFKSWNRLVVLAVRHSLQCTVLFFVGL